MFYKRWVWLFLPALFFLSACINEKPDFETCRYKVGVRVHVDTKTLPDYVFDYTRSDDFRLQYLLRVYTSDTETPVEELTLYADSPAEVLTADLQLPIGDYKIYAWASYCEGSNGNAYFYNTTDFNDITLKEPYEGDSEYKQAYTGTASFSLTPEMQLPADITVDVQLETPMAQYRIIANDVMEFVTDGTSSENMGDNSEPVSELSDTMEQSVKLDGYTVKVNYSGYLPWNFNLFQNNPFNSATGVSYEGTITSLSSNEALIAFDCCMVNGEESSVTVYLEIYDKNMELVNETGNIEIPTKRNRTTIVYGKFLTTQGDGGIGIDPDFDGQYNIEYK